MFLKNLFTGILLCCSILLFTDTWYCTAETIATADTAEESMDDFEDSGDLDDFESSEEPTDTIVQEAGKKRLPSFIDLNGDLTFSIVDNISQKKPEAGQTDWRDISSLKTDLFLELDISLPASWKIKISGNAFYDALFSLNDRDDYSDDVLDEEESGAELRKAYISGSIISGLDIKVGRQIVVWGKSDNIRVTDVLNPVNMKAPGITDLEDMRLPVFMTKLDYYLGPFNLSAIAIHEKRFNKLPEPGSDYFFYPLIIPEKEPAEHSSNTEYGVALNGTFSGWDASLYYADYYDKTPYFNIVTFADANFEFIYSRQTMIGGDVNVAFGNLLVKSEVAFFKNVNFSDYITIIDNIYFRREVQKRFNTLKSLGGLEYSGFSDTTLTIETMNTHVWDVDNHSAEAAISEDSWETTIRVTRNFFNDMLSTTALAMLYGSSLDEGSIVRLSCDYDMTDDFVITLGAIFYDGDEMMLLSNIKDSDRVYANFKYSF